MWRAVLGYPFAFLSGGDERGVWRPPGVDDVEVLVAPPIRVVPDAREHRLADVLAAAGWDGADCYLHCTPEYYPLPPDAYDAADRVALAIADWNVAGRISHLLRPIVDAIVCDHPGVPVLERPDGPPVVPGLLWGWDADGWPPADPRGHRDIDVLFVGNRNPAIHPERERWLARLGALGGRFGVQIHGHIYGEQYRALHERARLVFNYSVRGEANMRSFEAAVAGACVLNERGNPTLPHAFVPDRDYATYDEHDLEAVVDRLLTDDEQRLAVADAGQRAALDHSYDVHWAQILRDLRDALAGAPRRAPGAARAAQAIAEQWRCSSFAGAWEGAGEVARLGGVAPGRAARVGALSALGGPAGLERDGWERARSLLGDLDGGGDGAVEGARAEAAAALGRVDEAVEAARAARAAPPPDDAVGLAATRFDDWQLSLERSLLAARRVRDVRAAATRWTRRRAGWVLASLGQEDADGGVDDLLGDVEPVAGALLLRARLRLARGHLEPALCDLDRALGMRPLDIGLAMELADVLRAADRPDEAARTLGQLAASLAGFPAEALARDRLDAEARRVHAAHPTTAWCWADELDAAAVEALVAGRLEGALDAELLRLAVSDRERLDAVAALLWAALAARDTAPEDLPDTELVVDAHPLTERWRRLAAAEVVIAQPGSADEAIAARMGRPVVCPGAAAHLV